MSRLQQLKTEYVFLHPSTIKPFKYNKQESWWLKGPLICIVLEILIVVSVIYLLFDRSNETLDRSVYGKYDTEVLTKRAIKVIQNHKKSGSQQPLFMYLAYKAIHTPIKVGLTILISS